MPVLHSSRAAALAGVLLAGCVFTALAQSNTDIKLTQEGIAYRVESSEPAADKALYRILEREGDADAAKRLSTLSVQLVVDTPTAFAEVVTRLLKDSGLPPRFVGSRAVSASSATVTPTVVSGSVLGSLRHLAQRAGIQVVVYRDAVEFADRKTFVLVLPSFENSNEMASRLLATRATGIKATPGPEPQVSFEADATALQQVQAVVREIKNARKGMALFLASSTRAGVVADPHVSARESESSLVKQLTDRKTDAAPLEPAAKKVVQHADPLAVLVSMKFKGDAADALAQLCAQVGIESKPSSFKKKVSVTLALQRVPLQVALETLGTKLKGVAEVVYLKAERRAELRPI